METRNKTRNTEVTITTLNSKCQNALCQNHIYEGAFSSVDITAACYRSIRLTLCAPCATALDRMIRG
jgi:hypothetical protein